MAIQLRDYCVADASRLVELANNVKVSRYLRETFPFPYALADAEWWIAVGAQAEGVLTQVIEFHGEFVGSVGIVAQLGWRAHLAEIGYWLGEPYWGQGIATEALGQMSAIAFATQRYRKLFAPVLAPNVASMRVLEKCGYQLEGVLRQEVCKQGQYFDLYYYAKYQRLS
jgi:[ribosomal protein S5]-alanine N-acetyltransferase